MLTRSYWKNYGDFLLELVDTYTDDIAFKLARLMDSDPEFLQVKQFMETSPTEDEILHFLEDFLIVSTERRKIEYIMSTLMDLEISDEDIIGMLSMLETEENFEKMIRYLIYTPKLTEEKVVKAIVLVVRKSYNE